MDAYSNVAVGTFVSRTACTAFLLRYIIDDTGDCRGSRQTALCQAGVLLGAFTKSCLHARLWIGNRRLHV
jgi:hypothetical protein